MICVAYGGPTEEFQYNSVINEDEIKWEPASVKNSINEDDLYVQLTLRMTMDEYGIDAPVGKFSRALGCRLVVGVFITFYSQDDVMPRQ